MRPRRPDLAPLALVILLALLGAWPLLGSRLPDGHDALAYPPRLVELHENLRHGILPPRWAPDLAAGHGLPLFVACPPLVVATSELFHAAGSGLARSQNLALLSLYLLAGLGMYGAGREIGGPRGGLLAAASYLYAPYLHLDLYVRHAASEVSGLAVLPLLVWGSLRLGNGAPRSGSLLIAAGTAGAATAHSGILLLAVPLILVLRAAEALAAPPGARLRLLLHSAAAVSTGLLLGAFAWGPAFLERDLLSLHRLTEGFFDYRHHFLAPTQLLSLKWAHGYSIPGKDDGMGFGLGPLQVALAGLGALLAWRSGDRTTRLRALAPALVAAIGIALSLELSAPVWRALPWLRYLAFPWRLLALPALGFASLAAFAARAPLPETTARRATLLAVLALVALNIPHTRPRDLLELEEADFTPEALARLGVETGWAREYLTRWMADQPPFSPAPVDLQGEALETLRLPTERRFTLRAPAPTPVLLHIAYYPGWQVEVDGAPVTIEPATDAHGDIRFAVAAGTHEVRARFRPIPSRLACELLSLVGLGTLCLLGLGTRPRAPQPPEPADRSSSRR